jgi:hypothetical protein
LRNRANQSGHFSAHIQFTQKRVWILFFETLQSPLLGTSFQGIAAEIANSPRTFGQGATSQFAPCFHPGAIHGLTEFL